MNKKYRVYLKNAMSEKVEAYGVMLHESGALVFITDGLNPIAGYAHGRWTDFYHIKDEEPSE
jgi:hypothetical protein